MAQPYVNAAGQNASPAFLAGAAHGQQLAVQHHAATVPMITNSVHTSDGTIIDRGKNPNYKPGAAARTPAGTAAPTTQSLNDIVGAARQMANSDVSAQVNAIKQQQQQLRDDAMQRAQQIQLASQAGASFLTGIGDQTAASYSDAAKTLAGLASGFSGDVKTAATTAADQVAHNLSVLGAPTGPGQGVIGSTQAQVAAQPTSLANLLYNQGGFSPANLLETSGQAFAAAQRALPASTLAYGNQQAQGTLGQGAAAAKALAQQIIDAQATQPKLAQQYLAQLQSELTAQQNAELQAALAGSLIDSRTASTKIAQGNLTLSQQRLAAQQANSDRSYQLALARLSTTAQPKANSALSKSLGYLVDSQGDAILQGGQRVTLPKPAGNQKGPLGLSAKDFQKYTSLALGAARTYHSSWKDANGKDQPPLTWQQYLTHGEASGVPISILIKQGQKVYSPAERSQGLVPGG